MTVTLTQEETNMLVILTANSQNLNSSLQQSLAARKSAITLLENKYQAVFDEVAGQFKEKEKA